MHHQYLWNFCCRGADVPPGKTSLAVRSKEKGLYWQARGKHDQNLTWLLKHATLKSITHPNPHSHTHTHLHCTNPFASLTLPPDEWGAGSAKGSPFIYTPVWSDKRSKTFLSAFLNLMVRIQPGLTDMKLEVLTLCPPSLQEVLISLISQEDC